MSEQHAPTVYCQNCGARIDEPASTPIEKRANCPACGSTARHVTITLEGATSFRRRLDVQGFRAGLSRTKGRFIRLRTGDDLHHDSGQWNLLTRVIDYENDGYLEHIEDRDGNTVRHVDEPLSQHRGRGSAKQRGRS